MPDRILVLIPCCDCAEDIPRTLAKLQSKIASHIETILVLDNGSQDGTREAAISAALKFPTLDIRVARNRRHLGMDGSYQAGFHFALRRGYTHVLALSDAAQDPVTKILPVLQHEMHRHYDACLGAGLSIFNARAMRPPHGGHYPDRWRFGAFGLPGGPGDELAVTRFPVSKAKEPAASRALRGLAFRARRLFAAAVVPVADHRTAAAQEYRFDIIFPLLEQGVA